MKEYSLVKDNLFSIPVKKIHYSFKIEEPNNIKRVENIILHHTGNANTIQKIINNHIKKRHFSSIGYHILIGKNGQIYLSRDLDRVGAHTFGYNLNSIGIALLGNFNKTKPSEKQIESLERVIIELKKNFNIKKIMGHNQAIFRRIRKEYNKIPEKDLFDIRDDIEYYSFLKKLSELIPKEENPELEILFNKLKTCPGIKSYDLLRDFIKL